MNKKIWLSSPHMGGGEIKYVNFAFDENWIAPLGPNVNGFENDLELYLNKNLKVAALSSGTAALHLALLHCGVKAGDEVICQSLTFAASANPITYIGAIPVFVDSESDTWNICPHYLEKAIVDRSSLGKKPKAIVAVHLYGMPYKHDEVQQVADKYNIPIIEDAAEALGSSYKGRMCGTLGSFGVLSFNGNKIITTSGGGALVCRSEQDRINVIHLATQAKDDAPHYEHTSIGYNYRMSNVVAGIGRGQMEVLDDRVQARRSNYSFYKSLLKDVKGVSFLESKNDDFYSNHWLTTILIDKEICEFSLEEMFQCMNENDIECRHIWKPLHLQPVFLKMPYYGSNIAEEIFKNGICLPSGSNLTDQDKVRISNVLNKVINKVSLNN